MREWRYLSDERRGKFLAERRRYEERIHASSSGRAGVDESQLRISDLDVSTAALLFLSAANWAYTWLRPGAPTDELADRLYAALLDGMRGYATPGVRRPSGKLRRTRQCPPGSSSSISSTSLARQEIGNGGSSSSLASPTVRWGITSSWTPS